MKHFNMDVNQNKAKYLILTICNQPQMQVLQSSSSSVCVWQELQLQESLASGRAVNICSLSLCKC